MNKLIRRFTATSSSPATKLNLNFVPKHEPPRSQDIAELQQFLSDHSRILVITGITNCII